MPTDIFPRTNPMIAPRYHRERAIAKDPESHMIPEVGPLVEHLLQMEERDSEPTFVLRSDATRRLNDPGVLEGMVKNLADPNISPIFQRLFITLLQKFQTEQEGRKQFRESGKVDQKDL